MKKRLLALLMAALLLLGATMPVLAGKGNTGGGSPPWTIPAPGGQEPPGPGGK